MMPLSEQEQRLLDEMERHLMGGDADVVEASARGRQLSYRNVVLGVLLFLAGLGGLIAGVSTQLIIFGVIGFVFMFGGIMLAVTPVRRTKAPTSASSGHKASTSAKKASFMDRMGDRWDRRSGHI